MRLPREVAKALASAAQALCQHAVCRSARRRRRPPSSFRRRDRKWATVITQRPRRIGVMRRAASHALMMPSLDPVGGEAVEQAGAAGRLQRGGAAAARRMRRVPRLRRGVVAQAHAVVVTDHGRAFAALGPVAAGHVLAGGERGAVGLRAGEDVVLVDGVEPAGMQAAVFGERCSRLSILLLAECRSSTFAAICTPLALTHGPLPMRSRR